MFTVNSYKTYLEIKYSHEYIALKYWQKCVTNVFFLNNWNRWKTKAQTIQLSQQQQL